ncbi:hypothetical protein B1729_18480, partial [Microbacterium sp. B35-04]
MGGLRAIGAVEWVRPEPRGWWQGARRWGAGISRFLFRSRLRVVMSATPAFDSPGVPGDDALPAELASVMRLVAGFEAGRRERAAADAAEIR